MEAFLMVIFPSRFFATAPGLVSEQMALAVLPLSLLPKMASAASLSDICVFRLRPPANKNYSKEFRIFIRNVYHHCNAMQ